MNGALKNAQIENGRLSKFALKNNNDMQATKISSNMGMMQN